MSVTRSHARSTRASRWARWRTPEVRSKVEKIVVPRRPPEPGLWLDQVYRLCAEGKLDRALYLVLSELDELLGPARDLARCDAILDAANVSRMPIEARLAFLMGTFRARSMLRARAGFLARVEVKLRTEAPDRVELLLKSLR
jgi:hypothetical protein